jgi:hypothetical protein
MVRIAAALILLGLVCPSAVSADSRIFLGTRTGWARTGETFTCGKYNGNCLFLVIGTRPTTDAVCAVYDWETGSTFMEDVKGGGRFFHKQLGESASSVPENAILFGRSFGDLAADPVREIQDFSILTPATIAGKTVINILKIGWYAVKLPLEPVLRTGAGTLAMAGSPFIQPVLYTGKYLLLTGVAAYGYTSSAVGGGVLLGATGGVCALDIATSPFVATVVAFAD